VRRDREKEVIGEHVLQGSHDRRGVFRTGKKIRRRSTTVTKRPTGDNERTLTRFTPAERTRTFQIKALSKN